VALAALTLLSSCGSAAAPAPKPPPAARGPLPAPVDGNPLARQAFYVDPTSPAARQAAAWRTAGRAADAAALERIAARPVAHWFGESRDIRGDVRRVTTRASRAGRAALLVAYDLPGRDCGSYSAGGAASSTAYRRWMAGFAAGIGDRAATVILEPDAITQALTHCGSPATRAQRYALLRDAVGRLKAHPGATVYIDAGNVGWIQPARRLAEPLERAGIAEADGFALNVSNFYTTGATAHYGNLLSRALGGTHFVIDTSRNGRGPDTAAHDGPTWCNPPGRALGAAPTTRTGRPRVDAYLWIKVPGTSDGNCRPGAPAAGVWWPRYALDLARRADG
jgi:endoglucanase